MWIFGYGSLVWKADFPYAKKIVGHVKGYERRFWQASIDHRGVPGKPGRVVTLVPSDDPQSKVWGVAYLIHPKNRSQVMAQLDLREVMGYEKVPITFYPELEHPENHHFLSSTPKTAETAEVSHEDLIINTAEYIEITSKAQEDYNLSSTQTETSPFTVTMYYGNADNDHFVGPAPLEEMARQIYHSVGPSGRNVEYLYNLADAMRKICDEALDAHLQELESKVRELESSLGEDSDSPYDR